jgi:hypothetical protein
MPLLRPRVPVNGPSPGPDGELPAAASGDNIGSFAERDPVNIFGVDSLVANFVRGHQAPDQACAAATVSGRGQQHWRDPDLQPGLRRGRTVIPLNTVMGLAKRHWSSGGDPTCLFDPANGGHWFFSQLVSASPESKGGPFAGCFIAKANTCFQGIAVSTGSSPFGPYNVYFLNANFNPREPGFPFMLNDFGKISVVAVSLKKK